MAFNTPIILLDVVSVQDPDTGKRQLKIEHRTSVYADAQEVGLQEYYSAQSNKKELVAVFEIPAHLYHNESYLVASGKQYTITRTAKGRTPAYIRLPCVNSQAKEIVKL